MKTPRNRAILKPVTPAPGPVVDISPILIRARVGRQALCEASVHYMPGAEITLTPARAAQLGSLIQPITD